MAVPDLTTTLGVDIGDALKQIDSLAKQVEKLEGKLKVKQSVKVDTKDAESRFERASRLATNALNKNKKALQDLALSGKQGTQEWNNAVASLEKSVKAQRALDKASQATQRAVQGISDRLDKAGTKTTKLGALMQKAGSIGQSAFGGGLLGGLIGGGVAGAVTTAVSTLAGFAKSAFDEYKLLNTNLQNVGTLGVDAEGLAEFESLVTELSTTVPDKASDIMNGVYQAISAGVTGTEQDIVDYVETASKVAVAGLSDTESAVNGLSTITNAYGLGAEGAQFAADSLFAAIKAGKTSFPELNQAMAQVVPTASAVGIGFDTVAGSLAYLTANGLPTAQASTALNASFVALQKPNKELAKALKAGGLEISKMGEYLKDTKDGGLGFQGVLGKLQIGLKKTGQSVTQAFSSKQASKAVNTLLNNLGKANQVIDGVRDSVAKGGVAEGAYQAASQGIQVQLDIARNVVQKGFSDAFSAVIPVVTDVFNLLKDTLGPILSDTFSVVSDTIDALKPIVMPILAVIGGAIITNLVLSVKIAHTTLQTLLNIGLRVFNRIKEALEPLIERFGGFTDGLGEGVDLMEVFKNALNTIGGVISDVADIVVELASFLTEILVTAFELVVGVVDAVISIFQDQNKETKESESLMKTLAKAFNGFKTVLSNIKGTLAGVTRAFKAIKTAIADFVDTLLSPNFLKVFSGDYWSKIGADVAEEYTKGFNSAVSKAYEDISARLEKLSINAPKLGDKDLKKSADTISVLIKNAFTKGALTDEESAELFDKLKKIANREPIEVKTTLGDDVEGEVEDVAEETGKKVKTALQKAQAEYKDFSDYISNITQAKINQINQMENISAETRAEFIADENRKQLVALQKYAQRTFKVTTDLFGNYLKTGIKAGADETAIELDATIGKIINDLQAKKIALKAEATVEIVKKPEVDPGFGANLFDQIIEADLNAGLETVFDKVQLPTIPASTFANAFASGLAGLSDSISRVFEAGTQKNKEELEKQRNDLEDSLAKGEITFLLYQEKLKEATDQLAEDSPFAKIFDALSQAGVQSFNTLRESLRPTIETLAEGIANKTKTIEDAYGLMAVNVGSSFTAMVLDGQNAIKALLLAMLDGLQAMIPIISAQIFGLYSASPNPVNIFGFGVPGATAAGIVTAVFTSLVQVARGVVSASFHKGVVGIKRGDAPVGVDTIPAVTSWGANIRVDEGESLITRKATRRGRNAELLAWMNETNGDAFDWFAMQSVSNAQLSRDLNLQAIGVTFKELINEGARMTKVNQRQERKTSQHERELLDRIDTLTDEVRKLKGNIVTKQSIGIEPVINDRELIKRFEVHQQDSVSGF